MKTLPTTWPRVLVCDNAFPRVPKLHPQMGPWLPALTSVLVLGDRFGQKAGRMGAITLSEGQWEVSPLGTSYALDSDSGDHCH